jgi:hypothetical protein
LKTSNFEFGFCCLLIFVCSCLLSCQKPKEAKVIVTNHEFAINRTTERGFEVTAKGEIQNVGEVDVKNIVVSGYCRSCGEIMIIGKWFISDIEKTSEEQDVINYLATGQKEDFSFIGVAIYVGYDEQPPQFMPEKLEIDIVSFEPIF